MHISPSISLPHNNLFFPPYCCRLFVLFVCFVYLFLPYSRKIIIVEARRANDPPQQVPRGLDPLHHPPHPMYIYNNNSNNNISNIYTTMQTAVAMVHPAAARGMDETTLAWETFI